MRVAVMLALCSSGCDVVLGLEENEHSDRPAFCEDAQLFDDFTADSPPCPWGVFDASNIVRQRDGALELGVAGDRPMYSGCTVFREYDFTENGVFLMVRSPLRVPSAYNVLKLRDTKGVTPSLAINFDGSTKVFFEDQQKAGRMGEPLPYWRIRRAGANVVAEISADGTSWEMLADEPVAMPAKIAIDIGTGITAAAEPGSARFESFGVCN